MLLIMIKRQVCKRKIQKSSKKNKFIKEIDYKSYGNCKDINDMEKEQFLNANIILGSVTTYS